MCQHAGFISLEIYISLPPFPHAAFLILALIKQHNTARAPASLRLQRKKLPVTLLLAVVGKRGKKKARPRHICDAGIEIQDEEWHWALKYDTAINWLILRHINIWYDWCATATLPRMRQSSKVEWCFRIMEMFVSVDIYMYKYGQKQLHYHGTGHYWWCTEERRVWFFVSRYYLPISHFKYLKSYSIAPPRYYISIWYILSATYWY